MRTLPWEVFKEESECQDYCLAYSSNGTKFHFLKGNVITISHSITDLQTIIEITLITNNKNFCDIIDSYFQRTLMYFKIKDRNIYEFSGIISKFHTVLNSTYNELEVSLEIMIDKIYFLLSMS